MKEIATVFLFFLIQISSWAVLPESKMQFRRYQVNEGLSENTITSILQDKKGFLWVGTKDGLNQFDGISFKVFKPTIGEAGGSIGNNTIRSIIEADSNTLYIGTDYGVYRMNLSDNSFIRLEDELELSFPIFKTVTSLLLDKKSQMWITTMSQGVWIADLQKKELKRVELPHYDLRKATVWSVFEDKAGVIWIGTRIGLLRYNPNSKLLEAVPAMTSFGGSFDKEILSIYEDDQNVLWVGTWSQGILSYNKQTQICQSYPEIFDKGRYPNHIRCFLHLDAHHLLIGSDDGLYLFYMKEKRCHRIDTPYHPTSLGDQNIYSLFRDREGGIWVGTYFGGLNYLDVFHQGIETYMPDNKPGSLSGKAVSQMVEDSQGNIWIATEDGGINYLDTKTKRISQPIQTSYHNIHPLMLVKDELWIGTFSRGIDIYHIPTKRMRHYKKNPLQPHSLNDDCIFSLYQTRSGDIYVGTTVGLNKYNPSTDRFTDILPDSIPFVYDIKEDSFGNLWVASYTEGVFRYNPKTRQWVSYSKEFEAKEPIVNAKLTGIYIDSMQRLWFSSQGRGIFLYDYTLDRFINYSEQTGLLDNVVYGLLDDPQGNIWISTNKGLAMFDPQNPDKVFSYDQREGLQSNEFNYKASLKASDGKLYFGGINGFSCFYAKDIVGKTNKIIPSIEITDIQVLGNTDPEFQQYIQRCLRSGERIQLSYQQSSFTITFVGLSFVAPTKNRYAYQLLPVNDRWIEVGNNRSVTYLNLSPGRYKFKVKGSNNHGIWNEEDTFVEFEILPPFYASFAAKLIYLFLLAGVFFFGWKRYTKKTAIQQQAQMESYKLEQETKALQSKIDFFTNIAHEVRTPVSLIKAPLEEILLSKDGNQETQQNLSIIQNNCERLNTLINQLLDFRKMDSNAYVLSLKKIDLQKYLTELYNRFKKTAQSKKIDFVLKLPQESITIISDPDALTKIIGNFLTNAIKFTRSTILLELEIGSDQQLTVFVQDNGSGITDSAKEHIFDPFYQLESLKRKEGVGIGLFFAKHLSNILHGNVWVEDNPEGGSVFKFSFYSLSQEQMLIQDEESSVQEEGSFYISDTDSNKVNILIVEDNLEMLYFIEKSLQKEYAVMTAQSGLEAIKILDQNTFSLIVSDLMMPDMDGLELTKRIRENINYSHIPIVLLSAKTDNQAKVEGLHAGADVFIEKPFSITYLKAQISTLLSNRKALMESFRQSPFISYSALTTNKNDQNFIQRINQEIDKHIADGDFSIESLADELLISQSSLQRKFKSICGFTPGEYLRTYRLKKAAFLLLDNGQRINEVAYMVGFTSATYFTKCFAKQFGVLPKEFLKKNQKALPAKETDSEA